MKKLIAISVVLGHLALGAASAQAINLLTNGDFELGAPGPQFPGWGVTEEVPSQPGAEINNLEQIGFANPPIDTGNAFLGWLRPFVGNQGIFTGQNVTHNAVLSQTKTYTGSPSQTFTFKGWSRFEENYSGGLDMVDGNPSPTTTIWNLDFLDAGGSVIGGASPFDVRTDRANQSFLSIANDNEWYEHTLMATAPLGTASVRVKAGGYDLISNNTNTLNQSSMFDYFTLRSDAAPGTELLTNADLNTGPVTNPPLSGWTLVANPATAGAQGGNFSDNPNSPGVVGYWIRAFTGAPGDSNLSQRVAASEGDEFNFSAWAAFGNQYSGGTGPTKPSTITLLEVAFLDGSEQEISKASLDLWDEGLRNASGGISATPEAWEQFFINGQVAPANTAFVEVRTVVTGAFATMNPDQGAFFDDYVLELATATLTGDYNNDGKVDAADYVLWRKNPSAYGGDPQGYNDWVANFGAMAGSGSGNLLSNAGAVPEPASFVFAIVALMAGASMSRGRRSDC